MNVIEYKGLTKSYGLSRGLDGVTIDIPAGRIIGLLGPNGSGKTTLIKLTAGLLQPTEGSIRVCGEDIGPKSKAAVAYLSERSYMEKWMSVEECVEYFQDFYADFDRPKAEAMLAELGVDLKARIKTLSKGTLEKMHLVLVMSRHARVYLLDEPIGGVDPAARDYILRVILSNYDEGSTIIISTHLIADIEQILDDFMFIQNGKVVMYDSVDNIRAHKGMSLEKLFKEVFAC